MTPTLLLRRDFLIGIGSALGLTALPTAGVLPSLSAEPEDRYAYLDGNGEWPLVDFIHEDDLKRFRERALYWTGKFVHGQSHFNGASGNVQLLGVQCAPSEERKSFVIARSTIMLQNENGAGLIASTKEDESGNLWAIYRHHPPQPWEPGQGVPLSELLRAEQLDRFNKSAYGPLA